MTEAAVSPELIIVLVTPVGTPSEAVKHALQSGLRSYGYDYQRIRVSDSLIALGKAMGIEVAPDNELTRLSKLMEIGDLVCRTEGSSSALLLYAMSEMRERRRTSPSNRRAWIIDSAKRVEEVALLRAVYGDRVIVLSLQASKKTRIENLEETVKPQSPSLEREERSQQIQELVNRDLDERDQAGYGQNILRTFPMADVFVDVESQQAVNEEVARILDLLFGSPDYHPPTHEEFGMQLAQLSSTRSPELGLKVGAAIMRESTVIALGMNSHPTAGDSSPDYDMSSVEVSQLVLDTLKRLAKENLLTQESAVLLRDDPDSFTKEVLDGALRSGRIRDLTEFQAPVHAEMAALMEAAEHGVSIGGATVYVTAYPCHGCAKHLLRLGLKVKYIEPYPKSRAEAMYGDAATQLITPFTGIAPRRYHQLFTSGKDRKGRNGVRQRWNDEDRSNAQPLLNPVADQGVFDREAVAIAKIKNRKTS